MENQKEKPRKWKTWRTRLAQFVTNRTSIPDNIAIKRAVDLVEQCKTIDYLKQDGLYLDIGTGLGHIVEHVVNEEEGKNVKFLAADPTWKPLNRLKKRAQKEYSDKVLFMKAQGEHLPVKEKSLDGVTLFFVMHHIAPEDQEQIMSEIDRVLKEDGMLFLTEDAPENEEEKKKNAAWDRRLNFEPKDEAHYYKTNEEWLKFFDDHGYELVENIYFDEESPKKSEGTIRHRSYILKRKSKVSEMKDEQAQKVNEIVG